MFLVFVYTGALKTVCETSFPEVQVVGNGRIFPIICTSRNEVRYLLFTNVIYQSLKYCWDYFCIAQYSFSISLCSYTILLTFNIRLHSNLWLFSSIIFIKFREESLFTFINLIASLSYISYFCLGLIYVTHSLLVLNDIRVINIQVF